MRGAWACGGTPTLQRSCGPLGVCRSLGGSPGPGTQHVGPRRGAPPASARPPGPPRPAGRLVPSLSEAFPFWASAPDRHTAVGATGTDRRRRHGRAAAPRLWASRRFYCEDEGGNGVQVVGLCV